MRKFILSLTALASLTMTSTPAGLALAALLSSCAQGGRVAMGSTYAAVAPTTVQILFQSPSWPYNQIGIVSSQGAQVASDATVYKELQSQAAKLGADAVLVVSSGMKQYASFPGFATYNAFGSGNLYGNQNFFSGNALYRVNGFAMGPQSFVGLNVQGVALRRIAQKSVRN